MTKWVYSFGKTTDGKAEMRNLLGGKGANLAEMSSLGLPVPPGFTITTEVCTAFYDNDKKYPEELKPQVLEALATVTDTDGVQDVQASQSRDVACREGGDKKIWSI